MIDHAATAHLDTPKERAIRHDYELADAEVQVLKAKLQRVRMLPLSEEAEAMFYWQNRAQLAEQMLRRIGLGNQFDERAQGMETRQGGDGTAPSRSDDSPVAESDAP